MRRRLFGTDASADVPPEIDPDGVPFIRSAGDPMQDLADAATDVLHDWRRSWVAIAEDERADWSDYVDGIGAEFVRWEAVMRLTESGAES